MFALVLTACGGGGSQELGAFPNMTKAEGDAPFALVAPSTKSPAGFTYTSSDPTVATIAGDTVTILLAGTTTITASQASEGSWTAGSTTAILTVTPIVCTGLTIRLNGACVTTCIAPATRQNGVCTAPPATASSVSRNSSAWMPVTWIDTWDNANAYCSNTTINGLTGWRLPNTFELTDLYSSGLMNGQGWVLARTWSSTWDLISDKFHDTVDLSNGTTVNQTNGTGAYVACVK